MNKCHINKTPNINKCSLDKKNSVVCFTDENIIELVKIYNQVFPNDIISNNNKHSLIKELNKKLSNDKNKIKKFKKELKHELINKIKNDFLPKGPIDKTWLSSDNINDIMTQFEKSFSNYKFLGCVPIDINTVVKKRYASDKCQDSFMLDTRSSTTYNKMSCTDLDNLVGKKVGIIFNLDKHYQSGSHWTSVFIDFTSSNINMYYFDSVGVKPPKEVYQLKDDIKKWSDKNNKSLTFKYNTVQHQRGDSECGVYSINFISRMLNNETFEQIIKNPISDIDIHNCRTYYFDNY